MLGSASQAPRRGAATVPSAGRKARASLSKSRDFSRMAGWYGALTFWHGGWLLVCAWRRTAARRRSRAPRPPADRHEARSPRPRRHSPSRASRQGDAAGNGSASALGMVQRQADAAHSDARRPQVPAPGVRPQAGRRPHWNPVPHHGGRAGTTARARRLWPECLPSRSPTDTA